MTNAHEPVDIDGLPELIGLVNRLRDDGRPILLSHGSEIVAVLVPRELADDLGIVRPPTEDESADSKAAAGGWSEVNTDQLIEDFYERRGRPVRSAVER